MGEAYERIKEKCVLPSPTAVALEIIGVASDASATIADVASIVEKDPATASRLLKLVNSPFAGASRSIASIPEAVSLLGLEAVTSTAAGFSLISQYREGSCHAFDYSGFWSGSVAAGVAAGHIAHRLRQVSPDESFSCGLLCQIGGLAFATAYPKAYAYALGTADPAGSPDLKEFEREMFELDRNELAAEMMTDWGLPSDLCEAVRYQDCPGSEHLDPDSRVGQIARTLHLAVALSNILIRRPVSRGVLSSVIREARRIGLHFEMFAHVFDSIGRKWQTYATIFGVEARPVPTLGEIYSRELTP